MLLLIPFVVFLVDEERTDGSPGFYVIGILRHGGAAAALLVAGALAYWLTRPRIDRPIVGPSLLAGIAYLLSFPLHSIIITAVWPDAGQSLLFDFLSNWLGGLGGWSPEYLFGCVASAIIYVSLRWRFAIVPIASVEKPSRHAWSVLAACVLVAFGALLGWIRYVGIETEVQSLTALSDRQGYSHVLEGAARLRAELWRIVGWSSLPYIIVGLLLLVPPRKNVDSHRTAE